MPPVVTRPRDVVPENDIHGLHENRVREPDGPGEPQLQPGLGHPEQLAKRYVPAGNLCGAPEEDRLQLQHGMLQCKRRARLLPDTAWLMLRPARGA